MNPENQPAFPVCKNGNNVVNEGVTILDYFAAHALAGMCADSERSGEFTAYAQDSFKMARAMMAARAKTPDQPPTAP